MSCEVLTVGLVADDRPQSGEICRAYDFSQPAPTSGNILTFLGDNQANFNGDQLALM